MSHKSDAAPQEALGASPLKRRSLFAGAGALGALAATAAVLPVVQAPPAPVAKAQPLDPEGGYQVTEHVERYYQTARV